MSEAEKHSIVVAVSGGFDPVHIGHVRMFEEAKKYGDRLVVILNNDNWLKKKKKIVFMPEDQRKELIQAFECVDEVVLTGHVPDPVDMSVGAELRQIKPDIFANGGDRINDNTPEVAVCKEIGCKMIFQVGRGGKIQSSSWILADYMKNHNVTSNQRYLLKNMEDERKFDFNNLFIFEVANNHQGSRVHGLRIVNMMADIAGRLGVRGAIKLQFRDLDTFIHPDHRESNENKHIPRFLSTRLGDDEFQSIVSEAKRRNLVTITTPFDEPSVDKIARMGLEVIKIGSCSAHDWPLLERAAESGKPVICSTGGLTIKEIDNIVSFFEHRGVHFALMHCVAMYPTPNQKLHLNQIEAMRNRYPGITIGFSTHEDPSNMNAVRVAYAKGARIFENM